MKEKQGKKKEIPPPEIIIWEITKKCNFRCAHCIVDASPRGAERELTPGECMALIDDFVSMGVKNIYFSGGEPLLYKELHRLVEYGKSKGIEEISIASNGSILTANRLALFKDAGLTNIQISLDGTTPEENAAVRQGMKNAFEKAIQAIRLCRKEKMPVSIGVFLNPKNIDSIPQMVDLAASLGINMVRFSGFVPLGRGKNPEVQEMMRYSIPQMQKFFEYVGSYDPGRKGVFLTFDHAFGPTDPNFCCVAGLKSCYIGSEGYVYPCPSFACEEYIVGDLKKESFWEIWERDKMRDFHIHPESIKGHCAECPDLMQCKGGCRGVTFAYTQDINESFPNCLRRYHMYFAEQIEIGDSSLFSGENRELSPISSPFSLTSVISGYYENHRQRMKTLLEEHPLSYILWESTRNCNIKCIHCAVPKESWNRKDELSTDEVKRIFREFTEDFDIRRIETVAISGGEPLLREDVFEIISYLRNLGFSVGIDTNAYLTGRDTSIIDKLAQAGLSFPCISIDGLEKTHNKIRGGKCFKEVVKTIEYFKSKYPHIPVQTITMVSQHNFDEINGIFTLLESLGALSGRFGTIMPLGRAPSDEMNFLTPSQTRDLLQWIARKRRDFAEGRTRFSIEFTDNGWCGRVCDGIGVEGLVRDTNFLCSAGVTMGTIYYDGKLGACLSVPPELSSQGDLRKERPGVIWNKRFKPFRDKKWLRKGICEGCGEFEYCLGGGIHARTLEGDLLQCTYMDIKRAVS